MYFSRPFRRSVLRFKSIIVVQGARGKLQGVSWMIFRGYQRLGGEHERIKWTPKHSSRVETRNMTVSRVSWRTVVYFAIVACATVLY